MDIYINSILYNRSLVDGPGIRTVVFLQGCNLYCPECHNKNTWEMNKGKKISIDYLVKELNRKVINKKITISGGEPLMQFAALKELLLKLKLSNFNIALYTGHEFEEVPKELFKHLDYIKTGRFIKKLQTSVVPYVGSTNQKFERIIENETIEK